MYPIEMLKYHYSSLADQYFEESNRIMSENYSEEFSKEFDPYSKSFALGNESTKRRDKSMNSTAPVNLKGITSPGMGDVDDDVLSEPPVQDKTD